MIFPATATETRLGAVVRIDSGVRAPAVYVTLRRTLARRQLRSAVAEVLLVGGKFRFLTLLLEAAAAGAAAAAAAAVVA